MAADWIGINDTHLLAGGVGVGFCGETVGDEVTDALSGTGTWSHFVNHTHWFILDLGETISIIKVRGRSNVACDPTNVNIYISDDTGDWGAAKATDITTWQDTDTWVEIAAVGEGRYVKVEITTTEDGTNWLIFGKEGGNFEIFDVYGEPLPVTVVPDALLLELDLQTPTFLGGESKVFPGTLGLELELHTPTFIVADTIVSPAVLALELDLLTPILVGGEPIVFPDILALELELLTPTIHYDITVAPDILALELELLTPTIHYDITVAPDVLALELELLTPTIHYDAPITVSPDVLALELNLLMPFVGPTFPTLSTSPRFEGFVDEYSDETVIVDSYATGYPLLNPQFTFDAKNFLCDLRLVSQTDKETIMNFYNSHKRPFFWTNEQDDSIYFVVFMSKPKCVLDGAKEQWRLEMSLREAAEL